MRPPLFLPVAFLLGVSILLAEGVPAPTIMALAAGAFLFGWCLADATA